jgi:hypothetical protein
MMTSCPERRACRRAPARKVVDRFEDVQRREMSAGERPVMVFSTKVSRPQRKFLRLLGMAKVCDVRLGTLSGNPRYERKTNERQDKIM